MVYETEEGPDLIPADDGLSGADNNLASVPVEDRYLHLDQFITNQLAPRYDLVLLDLPGKEDNITLNGIVAAEHVVAPLCPGAFECANWTDSTTTWRRFAPILGMSSQPMISIHISRW